METIIYESLTLSSDSAQGDLALKSIEGPHGRGDLRASYVRTLLITCGAGRSRSITALRICKEVVNLGIWETGLLDEASYLPAIIQRLQLRRTSLLMEYLRVLEVPNHLTSRSLDKTSWAKDLTHLDVSEWHEEWVPWAFHKLPCLTHLALNFKPSCTPAFLKDIITFCDCLRVLALLVFETDAHDVDDVRQYVHEGEFDNRLVVLEFFGDNAVADWEAQNLGESNMWTDAENKIQQRRNAAI